MKILKSPQKVLIVVLTSFIVISCFLMVRLEIKAASLQSRLDAHHKSLENNHDMLDGLENFARFVKKNILKVDERHIFLIADKTMVTVGKDDFDVSTSGNIKLGSNTDKYLGYDSQKKLTYINHDGAQVSVGDITTAGKKHNGVLVRSANGNTQLVMTDKGLSIATVGKDGAYRLDLKPDKGIFKFSKGKSVLVFEKDKVNLQVEGDIQIGPPSVGSSTGPYLGYDSQKKLTYINHDGAQVSVGNITIAGEKHHGVLVRSANSNTQFVMTDKGLSIATVGKDGAYRLDLKPEKDIFKLSKGKSFLVFEKDKVNLQVEGDINISSKNGNVNINGKKVNLNE